MEQGNKRKREATLVDRKAIFAMLLVHVQDGELKRGSFVRVADAFGMSDDTVRRIWRTTLSNMQAHLASQPHVETQLLLDSLSLPLNRFPDHVFDSNKKANCGRKRILDRQVLAERTANLPLNERSTHRNHAAALGISLKSSWNLLNEKNPALKVVTSDIKPALTDKNKKERLIYCFSFVDPRAVTTRNRRDEWQFREMFDEVHIDEKWFYLTMKVRRYIMAANETLPHRTVSHKSHIEKVMFLCAQARPRHDTAANCQWDGKIGIWPVGDRVRAQRRSSKHKRGDWKWKNKNVDSEVYLEMMRDVVISIATKWPRGQ
jgi:hypothetical protein